MVNVENEWSNDLKDILERAKKCPNKRRMYVYEAFKTELNRLNLPSREYEQACRQIANYLKV